MRLFVLILISSLATSITEGYLAKGTSRARGSRRLNRHCLSRKGEDGLCVPLVACLKLRQAIIISSQRRRKKILNSYMCGYSRDGIDVCCPNQNSGSYQNPQEGLSISSAGKQPTLLRYTSLMVGKDSTPYRNRHLLPEDNCGVKETFKVLGGEETLIDEFPWMALVRVRARSQTMYICGGSLITTRYVLTAAHCIEKYRGYNIDEVRLGEHDLNNSIDCESEDMCTQEPQNLKIEEIIVHPNYVDSKSPPNDIALLRLKKAAIITPFVRPICLPLDELKDINYDNGTMWAAGWGLTSNDPKSRSLVKLKVELPIIPFELCADYLFEGGVILEDSQMCAGGVENEDTCSGDSGGPLMKLGPIGGRFRWYMAGIVSYGLFGCGTADVPTIYTNVGKFVNWILENIHE